MPQRANVTSVDAIAAFRSSLLTYQTKARPALEEISSDAQRLKLWLEGSQRSHWEGEVRRRARKLEEAQAALFSAKMSNLNEATMTEQAAFHRARQALTLAEEKLRKIKQWDRDYENHTQPLLRQLEKLNNLLALDVPNAAAHLAEVISTLDDYSHNYSGTGSAEPAAPSGADAAAAPAARADKPDATGKGQP